MYKYQHICIKVKSFIYSKLCLQPRDAFKRIEKSRDF